ncbi:hypothetical protein [Bradyrhizobium sp. Leo170]|uniref:hypothetical protein n=1 Tax=Bradyrhizobium sp. Leo170 TaxID=1571199 RepID=UPI00102E49E2|nr:hypothetical protein [Bradyrhizobium sp. Leo170]TAI63923.1 hypothetical protein CWO89_21620 [Bradyrhizobium sp. Leo170]
MLRRLPHKPPPSPAEKAERRRSGHREEQRRWRRKRQRDGERIAPATFDCLVVEYMVRTNWLDAERADDPGAVGLAYYEMVADAARRRG